MLLADRYDNRTHFIFELLQNAEDALKKQQTAVSSRGVDFSLQNRVLRLSHFGKPFDEADVQAVCGIALSTKDLTAIGRFGIGFKSVYTFTDRPEIHSGNEDLAIEKFVLPHHTNVIARKDGETQIWLPMRPEDELACTEIETGLRRLGPSALLFLRHIEEITWRVEGGASGLFMRSKPEELDSFVSRVRVMGTETGAEEVDQHWLVFHADVLIDETGNTGRVEIAFSIEPVRDSAGQWRVLPVPTSQLVVFFPTVVPTNLGFLIQGPYRTTPSRDNVPRKDPWNQFLVKETCKLVIRALHWMRDNNLLDSTALACLPLDRSRFPEKMIFSPLFEPVRRAFLAEALLPTTDKRFVVATCAKLGRGKELREVFSTKQMDDLYATKGTAWLSADITADKTPELHSYLTKELAVEEVTPASILRKITKDFLEAQSDEWMLKFYEFLSDLPSVRILLKSIPLVRLTSGKHVFAQINGVPQAFLPGKISTDFPTVKKATCVTSEARVFLKQLGITEPDPVDDVVRNILPKYREKQISIPTDEYEGDIERILFAFGTDSAIQRERLVAALKQTPFVMAIDAGTNGKFNASPGFLYISTERLRDVFDGIPNCYFVDDSYDCLRGEKIRALLEACDALRCPRPIAVNDSIGNDRRKVLRKQIGHEESSFIKDTDQDWQLYGLEAVIKAMSTLGPEEREKRARLIWESLADVEERRGRNVFEGSYTWTHYGSYKATFPASFLTLLNTANWVPNADGKLGPPSSVLFESLGWKENPFLATRIKFKPAALEQLALEAGLDPALLDALKRHGITSEDDLRARLGITSEPPPPSVPTQPEQLGPTAAPASDVYDEAGDLWGDLPEIPSGSKDSEAGDRPSVGLRAPGGSTHSSSQGGSGGGTPRGGGASGKPAGNEETRGGDGGGQGSRPFISFVGAHPGQEDPDPDGLVHLERMDLEGKAIEFIIAAEPKLQRTPTNNEGYDLFEKDTAGNICRWVEVKAMTGTLHDRPVGLSHTQFDYARDHSAAYWLYVVERAGTPSEMKLVRIQDPAGVTRTFTFDHGWLEIAQ